MRVQDLIRRLSPLQAAGLAGLLLLAGNCPYLGNPPFWDDLMGLHRQALFLARHGFDFAALWASGDFWSGGALVYKFNWPSLVYAVLYALFPPTAAHVAGHLLSIAATAAAAGCVFRILRQDGMRAGAALLWSLAFICEPLVSVQSTSLGQEPLQTVCFAAFLLAFAEKRHGWALGALAAAALVKPAALVPAMAYCAVLAIECLRGRSRADMLRLAGAVGLMVLIGLLLIADSDGASGGLSLRILFLRARETLFYFPLPVLLAAAGAAAALFRLKTEGYDREYVLWLFWTAGFFAGYLTYSVPLPRYAASAVPVIVLLAARALPRPGYAGFAALLLGVLLQSGAWYAPLPGHLRHSGEFLERSRAYLEQQEADRAMCAFLEERCSADPVVAKWPYVQMLAEPAFGYVRKPLTQVYCAGILPRDLENVRKYPDPGLAKTKKAYYIFVCNSFEFFRDFGVPLAPERGCVPVWMPADVRQRGYWLIYRRP